MDFGFTNDPERLAAAKAWRDAAIADGWAATPTYGDHEAQDSACTLDRDGFRVQVVSRVHKPGERWMFTASVEIWGPDRLAIRTPDTYNWSAIQSALQHCNYCHKDGVATQRVGFAGRCCAECLPEQRNRAERPGWTL